MTNDGNPDDLTDDVAESFDEDLLGTGGRVLSDEAAFAFPPDRLHGVPFVDSDVTDESLEDRLAQEQPEEFEEPDDEPVPDDDRPVELDDYPFDEGEEFPEERLDQQRLAFDGE